MAKSEHAERLDYIQTVIYKNLSTFGYSKQGRTFNRPLESGLIHVINLQLGRRFLSGKFTINLGVCVPEIYQLIWDEDPPRFVDHGDCEIRKRIGELISPSIDFWWDLTKNPKTLSKSVMLHIEKHGLPYLNHFISHDDIIQEWNEDGENIGLPPRAGLSIAVLLVNGGKHEQARSLLMEEYSRKMDEPYADFVVDIA